MLHNLARSHCLNTLESQIHKRMYGNNLLFTWWKVAPKDNIHSKNRHLCYWRNAIGEAIMSLIQNQQNRGYFEDKSISLLSQGVGILDLFSYIVQSLLFLQDQIDCCMLIHERRQLPSNEVLQMESVDEFMMYLCLRQKLKNDHSSCTSDRWRNG